MKKTPLVLLVLFSVFVLGGCGPKKASPPSGGEPTATPTRPVSETVKEAPLVSLVPTADGHWVNLEVSSIAEKFTAIDYELIYFADVEGSKIERGVTGGKMIDLNGASSFSKKVLFGSASCTTGTCKYKYDENVTEGTLTLKLGTSTGRETFSSIFRIQKGSEGGEGLSTGDGVFSFVSSALPKNSRYLTISTIGLPAELPSGLVAKSLPYSIYPKPGVKGTVSFESSEEGVGVYLWSGFSWEKMPTTLENGSASAEIQKFGVFVLAK